MLKSLTAYIGIAPIDDRLEDIGRPAPELLKDIPGKTDEKKELKMIGFKLKYEVVTLRAVGNVTPGKVAEYALCPGFSS